MKKLFIIPAVLLMGVVQAQTGNVGIGTTTPTATLHVKTNNPYIIRQEDNVDTSTGNYTIQSADNFGTFQKVPTDVFRSIQLVTLPSTGSTITQLDPNWQTTVLSITLPTGRWQITGAVVMRPSTDLSANSIIVVNCKLSVADTSSSTMPSNDIINGAQFGKGYFLGSYYAPSDYEIMKGNIYVNNSSGAPKTYYFIANISRVNTGSVTLSNLGSSSEPENQIFAIPIF